MKPKPIARLSTQKKGKLQLQIDIFEKVNESDIGNPVEIHEIINSRNMPVAKGYLNLRTSNSDENIKWFTLHTLSREVDSYGDYITKNKQNRDGQFLDKDGNVVESEDDAAMDYQLAKSGNKHFYVNKATVYLNNKNKVTGKEFKQTIANIKYFSEPEATHIKSLTELLNVEQEESAKQEIIQNLKTLKSDYGQYVTMFISSGVDFFKANGFEIREQKNKNFYKKKDFGDNVPF